MAKHTTKRFRDPQQHRSEFQDLGDYSEQGGVVSHTSHKRKKSHNKHSNGGGRTHKRRSSAEVSLVTGIAANSIQASGEIGEQRKKNVNKIDWTVLVAVILVCLFVLGYLLYSSSIIAQDRNSHESVLIANQYDKIVDKLSPQTIDSIEKDIIEYDKNMVSGESSDPFSLTSDGEKKTVKNSEDYADILNRVDGELLGYLSIQRADFSGPIYYGDVNTTLEKGVGFLPQTAVPADLQGIRSVFFGHTGLDDKHVFDNLDKLQKGDSFSVRMLKTTYHYKVFDISIVRPDQVDALLPQKDKTIVTLLTCTPKGINDHRLLVSGELTEVGHDKPEVEQTTNPSLLVVTLIPLAACVVGITYVWMRRQQLNSATTTFQRRSMLGEHNE